MKHNNKNVLGISSLFLLALEIQNIDLCICMTKIFNQYLNFSEALTVDQKTGKRF